MQNTFTILTRQFTLTNGMKEGIAHHKRLADVCIAKQNCMRCLQQNFREYYRKSSVHQSAFHYEQIYFKILSNKCIEALQTVGLEGSYETQCRKR